MKKTDIAIYETECRNYPLKDALFRPGEAYPEYVFDELANDNNEVYYAVREALKLYGLDEENYGTQEWNPLGELIKDGDSVLIKPNLVMDYNRSGEGTDCLFTNPAVIAPIVDYVIKAQKGRGRIVIGDAPMQECKFEKLVEESGLKELVEYYQAKGIDIRLVDFRELKSEISFGSHKQEIIDNHSGVLIDLGEDSEFSSDSKERLDRLRITNYDPRRLASHHNLEKHEYYVSKYLIEADVVINMPKPKTHRKAGVTIAMKNMVGINARKEFLPHHTLGSVENGGDEYKKRSLLRTLSDKLYDYKNMKEGEGRLFIARPAFVLAYVLKILAKTVNGDPGEGSWSGNHTISRTINDLNKILIYADKSGVMCEKPQRRLLIIGDMIIAGEKEGPVMPSPKELGVIAVGENPLAFDLAIAGLMVADIKKIPTLQNAMNVSRFGMEKVGNPIIISNLEKYNGQLDKVLAKACWAFEPTSGWKDSFVKHNS